MSYTKTMEHAAHVWYHDKVDALEKKGWERSAVFMRRLVIDAQAVVIYMAVCVLIFVIDLFTQGTAERLASPPYRYFYAKSPRSWLFWSRTSSRTRTGRTSRRT